MKRCSAGLHGLTGWVSRRPQAPLVVPSVARTPTRPTAGVSALTPSMRPASHSSASPCSQGLQAFLAANAYPESAISYHFCSAATLRRPSAFAWAAPFSQCVRYLLAFGPNSAFKPTRARSGYFRRWASAKMLSGVFLLAIGAVPMSAVSAETDISDCFYSQPEPEAIAVGKDETLIIELASGALAAVQFTAFSLQDASYRWRFRQSPSSEVQTGTGRVFENFTEIPLPGRNSLVLPKNGTESLYVSAGQLKFLWSPKDAKSAFAYHCKDIADVRVVPGSLFGTKP